MSAEIVSPNRRGAHLLIVFLALALVPGMATLAAMPLLAIADATDPSGCFADISIQHLFQLALTLLLIKVVSLRSRKPLSEWGLNLRQRRASLVILAGFCLVYLIPVFFVNILPSLRSGVAPRFGYPLTGRNIAGTLGFQFLLSGTCEEPLFRGFVMTYLGRSWPQQVRIGRVVFPVAGLWATGFFMLAHVSISFAPFSIEWSLLQQMWALGLGLYYAAAFARTGSLPAPVLSHNYSNGIIFLALYTMAAVMPGK